VVAPVVDSYDAKEIDREVDDMCEVIRDINKTE